MKRQFILYALLLLVVTGCVVNLPVGTYKVIPPKPIDGISNFTYIEPTTGDRYDIEIINPTVVTPTPTKTATPLPTKTPTLTPTPTKTNTPVPVDPSPTPDTSPLTPSPAPGKVCELKAKVAVKVRSTPSLSSTQTGTIWQNNNITVKQFVVVEETKGGVAYKYLWAWHDSGWSAVYSYTDPPATRWWFDSYDSSEVCKDVTGWDNSIPLPTPIAREVQVGLHVLVGANAAPILNYIQHFQVIKCLSSSWSICAAAKVANPKIVTIYRTLTLGDNPPNLDSPDSWYYLLNLSWQGIDATYFEYMNEYVGDWDKLATFSIRMMELAQRDNRCLLLFSFAPGNPGSAAWLKLQPALDYAYTHPCRPGEYHGVALHQPGYAPAGLLKDPWVNNPWIAGAHRMVFADLFQYKYTPRLPVYITELGYDNGRRDDPNLASCDQVAIALPVTIDEYESDKIIRGVAIWSFGLPDGVWVDRTACIPQIVASLG